MNQRPLGPEPSALPNCATPRHGADGRIRTADLFITSELLYRLSHISISSLFILQNNNAFVNDATAILSKYFTRAQIQKIVAKFNKINVILRGLRARQNLCAIFERKRFTIVFVFGIFNRQFGSIAQLGEHLPYKQGVIGSSPIVSTKRICESGSVVERCLAKANVASSNLVSRSSDIEVREQRTEISVERDIREFGCPQSGSFREVDGSNARQ